MDGAAASVRRFSVLVPGLRTKNKNAREHFAVKAKRVRHERAETRRCLNDRSHRCPFAPPLVVTLSRLSSAHMDSDNVVGALAAVRDEVAAWLGIDDRHDDLVEYRYRREKCPRGEAGVRIVISPHDGAVAASTLPAPPARPDSTGRARVGSSAKTRGRPRETRETEV
jgi:hypothetical protein